MVHVQVFESIYFRVFSYPISISNKNRKKKIEVPVGVHMLPLHDTYLIFFVVKGFFFSNKSHTRKQKCTLFQISHSRPHIRAEIVY